MGELGQMIGGPLPASNISPMPCSPQRLHPGLMHLVRPMPPPPLPRGRVTSALHAHARTYHIADDGVISTRRLVEVLAKGLGVKPRLVSVPRWLAIGGATLLGKGAMARRLFDDLEVDDSDFRRDFAWKPTVGLEDGLRAMASDYARRMREGQV